MQQLLTILHILAALAVIGLVLIQRGKGSDMGMGSAGGGASQTMFGSQGSTPFLVKLTGSLAFVFFVTSALLSFYINQKAPHDSLLVPVPVKMEQMIPTEPQKIVPEQKVPPTAATDIIAPSQPVLPLTTAPKSMTPIPKVDGVEQKTAQSQSAIPKASEN